MGQAHVESHDSYIAHDVFTGLNGLKTLEYYT